jgi:hypothetical protein
MLHIDLSGTVSLLRLLELVVNVVVILFTKVDVMRIFPLSLGSMAGVQDVADLSRNPGFWDEKLVIRCTTRRWLFLFK